MNWSYGCKVTGPRTGAYGVKNLGTKQKQQPLDLDLGFARKPRRGAALFTGGGSEVAGVGVSPERR